jgi:hypothetical protein
MQHVIRHERFQKNQLTMGANGLTSPKLFLNGEPVKGKKNVFVVEDDAGVSTTVSFKYALPDIVPKVIIDYGEPISVVDPIPWYGWVLALLPMTLIFMGGAVGGGLGAAAGAGTLHLMRSKLPEWAQVLLSLAFTAAAAAIYMFFVIIITLVRS